jgi:hypothetical protein
MIIYYFSKDKKGYYEGPKYEADLHHVDYIIVDKRPGPEYDYNFDTEKWEKTQDSIEREYKIRRIQELRRIQVYKDDPTLTTQEEQERDSYINNLKNLDFTDVQSFEYPVCPDFMKN